MTLVSRISHILCKPGALVHESYMSLYSYLLTCCVMPFLIFGEWYGSKEARTKHFLEDVPLYQKFFWFVVLFVLTLVKVFKMERGIMKRFVEDYDPEVHEKFPFFKRSTESEQVVIEDPNNESRDDVERSRSLRNDDRAGGSSTDRRYNEHVNSQRRNTVNLACLQLLFLTVVYWLLYEFGLNIEDDYEEPALAIIPCFFAIWLITKPLVFFTYFDDLILTY